MSMRPICLATALLLTACAPSGDDTDMETDSATASDSGDDTASDSGGDDGSCEPNPTDPSHFVVVGFWNNDPSCTGEPMITNSFPVTADAGCYCWPGNSGSNSADSFSCDTSAQSFTYTQYNSLTCGDGDNTPTVKTAYVDQCTQDIPQNLYKKIVDFGACAN